MSWSYRICKQTIQVEGRADVIKYSIKEVFNRPMRHTIDDIGAVCFLDKDGEENTEEKCIESIRKQLTQMLADTYRPVYKPK